MKLHCNQPHHRDAAVAALDVPADRDAVTAAVARRPAAIEPAEFISEMDSPFGTIRHVRFPGSLPGWVHGPHLPGSDRPEW